MSNRKHQGTRDALLRNLEAQITALQRLRAEVRVEITSELDPGIAGPMTIRLQVLGEDLARLERRRDRLQNRRAGFPGPMTAADVVVEELERRGMTPRGLSYATSLQVSEVLDIIAGRRMTERQAGALVAAGLGTFEGWRQVSGGFAPD